MNKVLVTAAAGFIGSHTSRRLLQDGVEVVGFDNFNDYYSVSLKEARAAELERIPGFQMVRGDLADRDSVRGLFDMVRSPSPSRNAPHLPRPAHTRRTTNRYHATRELANLYAVPCAEDFAPSKRRARDLRLTRRGLARRRPSPS